MELKELEAALEGVLFAAGEPVGVERLCLGLEVDRATMDAVAQRLMDRYSYVSAWCGWIPATSCALLRNSLPISARLWRIGSRRGCPSLRWRCWR